MRKRSGRPPRWAAIPNTTIDDAHHLDLTALGLLTALLRHRDGWDITLADVGRRYGHGEDAMAAAMGALQIGHYIVKVRVRGPLNRWSTEVVVYDTPATEEEITALLDQIRAEPDVRAVQVIPPTKTALTRHAKRTTKRARSPHNPPTPGNPRLGQHRDPTDSGVTGDSATPEPLKKTSTQKTPPSRPSVSHHTHNTRDTTERRTDTTAPQRPAPTRTTRTRKPREGAPALGEPDAPPGGSRATSTPGTRRPRPAPAAPVARTPGVELLLHIGAQHPGYLLTGPTLVDQGAVVTRMLAAGWTRGQLRDVITRPLPKEITTSVGAIVAHRLREATAAGPPMAFGAVAVADDAVQGAPAWDATAGPGPAEGWTQTPPAFGAHDVPVHVECEGQDGGCGRPVRPGYHLCTDCLGFPVCACGTGRYDPGQGEDRCRDCRSAAHALVGVLAAEAKAAAARRNSPGDLTSQPANTRTAHE